MRTLAVFACVLCALVLAAHAAPVPKVPAAKYSGVHKSATGATLQSTHAAEEFDYEIDLVHHLTIFDEEPDVESVSCHAISASSADMTVTLKAGTAAERVNYFKSRLVQHALVHGSAQWGCLSSELPFMRRLSLPAVALPQSGSSGVVFHMRATLPASSLDAVTRAKVNKRSAVTAASIARSMSAPVQPMQLQPVAQKALKLQDASSTTSAATVNVWGLDENGLYEAGQKVYVFWSTSGISTTDMLTVDVQMLPFGFSGFSPITKLTKQVAAGQQYTALDLTDAWNQIDFSWLNSIFSSLPTSFDVVPTLQVKVSWTSNTDVYGVSSSFRIRANAIEVTAPADFTIVSAGQSVTIKWAATAALANLTSNNKLTKVSLMQWNPIKDKTVTEYTTTAITSTKVFALQVSVQLPTSLPESAFPYYFAVKYDCERGCPDLLQSHLDFCSCTAKSPFITVPLTGSAGWNVNKDGTIKTASFPLFPPFTNPQAAVDCSVDPTTMEQSMRCMYKKYTSDLTYDPLVVTCNNCYSTIGGQLSKFELDVDTSAAQLASSVLNDELTDALSLKKFTMIINGSLALNIGLGITAQMHVDTSFASDPVLITMRPQIIKLGPLQFVLSMEGDSAVSASILAQAHGQLSVNVNGTQPFSVVACAGDDYSEDVQGVRLNLLPMESDIVASPTDGTTAAAQGQINVTMEMDTNLLIHFTRYIDIAINMKSSIIVNMSATSQAFAAFTPAVSGQVSGKTTQELKAEQGANDYLFVLGNCNVAHLLEYYVTMGLPSLQLQFTMYFDFIPLVPHSWKLSVSVPKMSIAASKLLQGCSMPVTSSGDSYHLSLVVDTGKLFGDLFVSIDSIDSVLENILDAASAAVASRSLALDGHAQLQARLHSTASSIVTPLASLNLTSLNFGLFSWLPTQLAKVLQVPSSRLSIANLTSLTSLLTKIPTLALPATPEWPADLLNSTVTHLNLDEVSAFVSNPTTLLSDTLANVTFAALAAKISALTQKVAQPTITQMKSSLVTLMKAELAKLTNKTELLLQVLPQTVAETGLSYKSATSVVHNLFAKIGNVTKSLKSKLGLTAAVAKTLSVSTSSDDASWTGFFTAVDAEATYAANPAEQTYYLNTYPDTTESEPSAASKWFSSHQTLAIAIGCVLGALLLGGIVVVATRRALPTKPSTPVRRLTSREIKVRSTDSPAYEQHVEMEGIMPAPPVSRGIEAKLAAM